MLQALNTRLFTIAELLIQFPYRNIARQEHEKNCGLAKFFIFLLSLAVVVYARAIFFPILGIDTFTYAISEGYGDIYFEIMRGTWSFMALNQIIPGPLVSPLVSMLFFLVVTTAATFLVTLFWAGRSPGSAGYIVGSVMILFPYWSSQAYFNYYHYGFSLSTLMGALSVILPWYNGGWQRCLAAVTCFVAGTSLYQGTVTTATGLAGASLLVAVLNNCREGLPVHGTIRSLLRVGLVLLVGSGAYMLLHALVKFATGMPNLNSGYYAVYFSFSISRLIAAVPLVIPGSPLLLPKAALGLLCVPVLLFCWGCLGPQGAHDAMSCSSTPGQPRRARRALLWLPLLLALAVLSPLSLSLVQNIQLASRSTVSIAFVWAALFFLAASVCRKRERTLLVVATVSICILFAGRINYVWQLQTLTTEADMSDARRMNQQIYSLPEFFGAPKPVDVAFAGCLSADARSWPQDRESIFGLSQFACFGSGNLPAHAGAVLRFVGGHIKTVPVTISDQEAAASRKPWPAPESVFWHNDHVVIWLGPPKRKVSDMRQRIQWLSAALGIALPAPQNSVAKKNAGTPALSLHPLLERVADGHGPWPGHDLRATTGYIDSTTPLPHDARYVQVKGWAFDLLHKVTPQFVALLNCQGQIAGIAATGVRRKDLLRKVAVDADYAGFDGFALAKEEICGMAY